MLARELYPGKYRPTLAHSFIALLAKKNLLRMLFTQNIDCLERLAGVPDSHIIEAHGSFATQRCIECKTLYPNKLMHEAIHNGEVPHCLVINDAETKCNGLVKPDVVFFGEALPEKFHQNRMVPGEADLAIIMGTSLTVQPFASLPQFVESGVPRVLFNMELVGGIGSRSDDVCVLGDCDSGVRKLADELGWREELEAEWKKVSGNSVNGEAPGEDNRSRDEKIADEVDKLTSEIDEGLKFSSGHVDWVQKELDMDAEMKTTKEGGLESKVAKTEPYKKASAEHSMAEANVEGSSEKIASSAGLSISDHSTTAQPTSDVVKNEPAKVMMD